MKQTTTRIDPTEMVCPVTGKRYLTRPEWFLSSNHHSYRIGVLEGEIILCQSFGRTYVEDVVKYCSTIEAILGEFMQPGRKMVLLEDYTHLSASDNATRQTYIDFHTQHQDDLHGIFFFGLNPFLKLFVRLSRRILPLRFRVEAFNDYHETLAAAYQHLGRAFLFDVVEPSDSRKVWRSATAYATFQSPDADSLVRVALHGSLERRDVASLAHAFESFLASQALGPYRYFLHLDLSDFSRTSFLSLYAAASSFNRLNQLFPAQHHVVSGLSWPQRFAVTALNFSCLRRTSLVPKGVDPATLLGRLPQAATPPSSFPGPSLWNRLNGRFGRDQQENADKLMEFIGGIQWDSEGVATNPYPPENPFHQVAASLLVVKSDFDHLLAERVRREHELEAARLRAEEANRLQARFLANVSHEIRTPLNAILGMGEMLADTPLELQQQELLRTMRQSSQGLLTVINDILDLSRMEAGEFHLSQEPFDPGLVFEDVGRMLGYLAISKGLEWRVHKLGAIPGALRGDPIRIRQVLINLAGNAVKFTERGHVAMEMRRMVSSGGHVILQVRIEDTGPGIPSGRIGELFQPFRQLDGSLSRRHGGTGLGLAIAHNLVRQMGGSLGVESSPSGSVFTFRMHLEEVDPALLKIESSTGTPVELSGRILVAEDNRVNQKVVLGMLRKLGLDADIAENGRVALERLTHHSSEHQLVLMDIQMPEMDGIEAVQRMRQGQAGEHGRRLPVIALTAHAMEGDREQFLRHGMDDYLSKPMRLQDLRAVLERWLGKEHAIEGEN
ncbi:MAG: response regulator [Fibrobacteres bacterium]|nr:response regulator [Fibrobacterota bacterium]